jgi:hypothetical protein
MIIPNFDNWTLVLVGAWAPQMFNHIWFSENVLIPLQINDNTQMEYFFGNSSGYRIVTSDLAITPLSDRLIIGIRKNEDATLRNAQRVLLRILDLLPHNPIVALGVNFAFTTTTPTAEFLESFEFKDATRLASMITHNVVNSEINRTINFADKVLNLKTSSGNGVGGNGILCNLHYNLKNAIEVKTLLENADKVISLRDFCLQTIETLYSLSLENGEELDE